MVTSGSSGIEVDLARASAGQHGQVSAAVGITSQVTGVGHRTVGAASVDERVRVDEGLVRARLPDGLLHEQVVCAQALRHSGAPQRFQEVVPDPAEQDRYAALFHADQELLEEVEPHGIRVASTLEAQDDDASCRVDAIFDATELSFEAGRRGKEHLTFETEDDDA